MSDESKSDLKRSEEELKELVCAFEEGYQYQDHDFAARLRGILTRCPELCDLKSVHSMLVLHLNLLGVGPELVEKVFHSYPVHCAVAHSAPINTIQSIVASHPHALTEKVGINEDTPLHIAANHHHDRVVFELLATPESVRVKNQLGELPLHTYCDHHWSTERDGYDLQVDLVRLLVGMYPESVYEFVDVEYSPLHIACWHATEADLAAIEFLVTSSRGGTIAHADDHGGLFTPLHVACDKRASQEIIHYLIQALPDHIRALDFQKRTPLHQLCEDNPDAINDLPQIKELVEAYPESLALFDSFGNTPLHFICAEANANEIPVIQFLTHAHPEAQRVKNRRGYTPLHVACEETSFRDIEVIRFLAQECPKLLGASSEAADGVTPLHLLATANSTPRYGHDHTPLKSYMEALGVSGEAAKAKDSKGRIPLRYVVERYAMQRSPYWDARYCEIVDCLLEAFPGGVMTKDNDGNSALEYACENNAELTLIYQLISVNPIVTMGLESGRREAPSSARKRKADDTSPSALKRAKTATS